MISAYAQQGDTDTAGNLLKELESHYQQTRDPDFRPTSHSFNAVIKAYAKKGDALRAEEILRRLLQFSDIESTLVTWNTSMGKQWSRGLVGVSNCSVENNEGLLQQQSCHIQPQCDYTHYFATVPCEFKGSPKSGT